jgi:hypothetical protein
MLAGTLPTPGMKIDLPCGGRADGGFISGAGAAGG